MLFDAVDAGGAPIYHTNVILCVARRFAVVCSESVRDSAQRNALLLALRWPAGEGVGRERVVVEISLQQVKHMCGNLLEVRGRVNHDVELTVTKEKDTGFYSVVVMSSTARKSFTEDQMAIITANSDRIALFDIPTIERIGGGSARCMVAEVFA